MAGIRQGQRTLGRSGIQVSPLGMGCWAIGGVWQFLAIQAGWGEVDDNESIRAVQHAMANGINFFDTAANYGTGHSERILSQALAGKRDQVVIATKFGFNVLEAEKRVARYENDEDLIKNVRAECEASLRRLNTDYIDLYQLHVWDYALEPAARLVDVLESLVTEGKIRYYGWSTDSVEAAKVFAEGEHCVAIQHDLNVVKDAPEMLELCEKLNLASVNRSPLARGALTGKYTKDTVFGADDVRNDQWSQETFLLPAVERLDVLREILTSEGRTLAQGALAWIWARSEKTVPIPGIRTVAQADENAKAMQFGALKADQMRQIEDLLRQPVNS
ncbi:MAG TPA: aldo/keto reductase [Phototrophicaceae bacterium]|nr:aldo/keto reductase [Phototrophicaceae bacterium]